MSARQGRGIRPGRETSTDGIYKVAIEYEYEEVGRAALEIGRRLCLAAIHNHPFDVAAEVETLRRLRERVAHKPETLAFLKAAKKRRIPVRLLGGDGLLQLGHGVKQHRLQGPRTDRTSATAESIASDHHLSRKLLHSIGVPVPPSERVSNAEEAWEAAEEMGLPVSLRLRYGKQQPGFTGLASKGQVEAAYEAAEDRSVLVERALPGKVYQLLVVGHRVACTMRMDDQGAVEVTAQVHPDVAARAARRQRVVGLDIAAVEIVAEDIRSPLEGNGGVLAVYAEPDLRLFFHDRPRRSATRRRRPFSTPSTRPGKTVAFPSSRSRAPTARRPQPG